MTSPNVTYLPRRLEPVSADPFVDVSTPVGVTDVVVLRPLVPRPVAPVPPRAAA